ncbi:MAG: helix-turn-helix domain-containing protein [Eubacterium sp.]|nr:helix-turn-helix domain-containing protein [Eubacterium sp.]
MISYKPLWKTMDNKKITQYKLLQMGLDKHTLQKLRDNKSITMNTLEFLCSALKCTPNEVIEFIE